MRRGDGKTLRVVSNAQLWPEVVTNMAQLAMMGSDIFDELPSPAEVQFEPGAKLGCNMGLMMRQDYRPDSSRPLKVVTSYPAAAEKFYWQTGIDLEVAMVVPGKVEGYVAAGIVPAALDVVETGSSVAANGLKVISELPIMLGGLWRADA